MATETRRVIFRHPRGIYETVEVTGEAFGEPYRYTETVRTPKRDERRMVNPKEDAKARCEAKRNASATPEERSWSFTRPGTPSSPSRADRGAPTLWSRPSCMPAA